MAKELMNKVTNNDNLRRYVHMALSKINKSSGGGGMSPEEVEAYVEQALTQFGNDLMTINRQSLLGPGNIDACMVETTWQELKDARDNGELVPGTFYRITDYATTTSQESTRSAGHQFDIIVQAISESVLNEDARAIQHEFEIPEKCYSIDEGDMLDYIGFTEINGEKCYVYGSSNYEYAINAGNPDFCERQAPSPQYIYSFFYDYFKSTDDTVWSTNEKDDTEYVLSFKQDIREFSYFSNSNLAAWKLKYCLDNDTNRFAWAQSGETIICPDGSAYSGPNGRLHRCPLSDNRNPDGNNPEVSEYKYAWGTFSDLSDRDPSNFIYSKNEVVVAGETVYNAFTGSPETINEVSFDEGKGVIYQMIDEYNNNCPYDFKNIQFLRSEGWQNNHPDWTDNAIDAIYQDIYFYTFSSFINNILVEDVSVIPKTTDAGFETVETANNNTILPYVDEAIIDGKLYLNDIILIVTDTYDSDYHLPKFNTFRYHCKNISLADEVENNTFNGYISNFCSCGIFISNTIYSCMGYENAGNDIDSKIIYAVSGTIHVKGISDAFSET